MPVCVSVTNELTIRMVTGHYLSRLCHFRLLVLHDRQVVPDSDCEISVPLPMFFLGIKTHRSVTLSLILHPPCLYLIRPFFLKAVKVLLGILRAPMLSSCGTDQGINLQILNLLTQVLNCFEVQAFCV